MDQTAIDRRWMDVALRLGARGMGQTWPNPFVGCVIVKKDRVIGRGWTQPSGRPHGEVMALEHAGDARGATAYVTLEPCAHHGKTPPCASALIDNGITRVVIATRDPDPRVSGKGIKMLQDAGIEIVENICKADADIMHAGFFKRIKHNRPFVTLKLATSMDGKIATKTGQSQWITGERSRSYVHYLRSTHDAVMVGSGTSIADNPTLTVRGLGPVRQPVRIVLDSHLKTDPKNILGQTSELSPVWMCHNSSADTSAWQNTHASLIECHDGLDIDDVLSKIAQRGITRVFCEGGGKLAASLLNGGFVDQIITMTAGIAIGADGLDALASLNISKLENAPRFIRQQNFVMGQDHVCVWGAKT